MRKSEEDQGAKVVKLMANILLGGVIALGVCLVILFLCSVGISGGWFREEHMLQLTMIGCAAGALVGGSVAVARCRMRTLVVGLGVGAVLFLLLLTAGLLLYGEMAVEERGLGLLCAALFGGALAGLLGGKPRKKRKK